MRPATSDATVRGAKAPDPAWLLQAVGLSKNYVQGSLWRRKSPIKALDNVDIALQTGKTVAVIGKSGSGKSTLAMCLALLEEPDEGDIIFRGRRIRTLDRASRRALRPQIQIIFQSTAMALSPRLNVIQLVEEPLKIQRRVHADERCELVIKLLEQVGLDEALHRRRPHELSGGQRQRVAIARSLALNPSLLVLDEPFVGLDAPIRNQIVNLLLDLQERQNLTYLYISHDLEMVGCFADSTLTMDHGKLTAPEARQAYSN